MVAVGTIAAFDFAVGGAAGVALLYLLYSETVVVHYARFFRLITAGLLGYAVTGPVVGTLAPEYIHAVHGVATLAVVGGLYGLVRDELEETTDFERVLGGGDEED